MNQTITAIYEDGVLRPLSPLSLPDKTRVTLQINQSDNTDPVLELLGLFNDDKPLIDNIPVSEDADLYIIAAAMGKRAEGLHAWEIAPTRYERGSNNEPIRFHLTTFS